MTFIRACDNDNNTRLFCQPMSFHYHFIYFVQAYQNHYNRMVYIQKVHKIIKVYTHFYDVMINLLKQLTLK